MTRALDRMAVLIGTAFYLGYAPIAPGTVGSLGGVAIVLLFWGLGWKVQVAAIAAVTALGVWAAGRCENLFGEKDSSRVVIDEVAGYLLALAFLPARPLWVAGGFILFRFFDIIKPPPAGWIDLHLKGGPGVVGDDLVAGLYTWLVLQASWRWLT